VSVTLKGYATDGAGSGSLAAASQSASGGGLGPYFQQPAFGVVDGQYIEFSGFTASFDVVSLDPPSGEFIETIDAVNNWTVETIGNAPVSVDIDVQSGQPGNALHPHHDGSLGPQGIASFPDDVISVSVLGSLVSAGDPVDFNTDDIDPTTLAFGPGAGGTDPGTPAQFNQNVDADGIDDATFGFRMSDSDIACGETSATLTGVTTGGQGFEGSDTILTNCNVVCH
jgi:hypothetical protein